MNKMGLRDRALDLNWRPALALLSIPSFALYFAGVVGGSMMRSTILPRANMGWLQQVGGIVAVAAGVALLRSRRVLLALFMPERPWLVRSVLVGLSITAMGTLASALTGDPPERHGLEYFAYQATMPGIGEELGFRGLVLGLLLASLGRRSSSTGRLAALIVISAVPFAALHILERDGFALVVLFAFTLYAGIALGWLRLTTGSLLAAILAHNIANVASGLLDNVWLAL